MCLLAAGATVLCAIAAAAPLVQALAQDNAAQPPKDERPKSAIVLLFDSSGSMARDDGTGKPKIDTARAAIQSLIESSPRDALIGLRVFGGRFGNKDRARGCKDSRALFPVGGLDPAAARAALKSYRPKGFTPIALSLRRAVSDLPGTGRRTIILVSDGQETCGPPAPCRVAGEIARRGVELKIQTIGFRVNRRTRRELQCIARAGNGVYRDVQDAPRLAEELRALSARALRDYVARGRPISGGRTARQAATIGPGQFLDSIGPDEERWYSIELGKRETLQATSALIPRDRTGLEASGAEFTLDIVTSRFEEAEGNNTGASTGSSVFDPTAEGAVDSIGVVGRPVGVGSETSESAGRSGFGREGRYYLRVKLEDSSSKDLYTKLDGRRVDVELLVNVLGRKGGLAPAPDESGVDPADPSSAPAGNGGATGDGSDDPPALVLALVALGATGVGIAAALALRRPREAAG